MRARLLPRLFDTARRRSGLALLTGLITMMTLGCERDRPAPPAPNIEPPSGSGRYTDDEGHGRTLFRPVGMLCYGDQLDAEVPGAAALFGYEFFGNAGDAPTAVIDIQGTTEASIALYGPRDADGLWGRPLAHSFGGGVIQITDAELPLDGYYFLLVRHIAGPAAAFTLALTCPDCPTPICSEAQACDLYCELGYSTDDAGERLCQCTDAPCETADDCLDGEICDEGTCRPAPTCEARCREEPIEPVCSADGQTLPNACVARCIEVEFEPGACPEPGCDAERPCPDNQLCDRGMCVCDCPIARQPVCSTDGRTYSNRCELECRGGEFAYDGECDGRPVVDGCGVDAPCEDGLTCAGEAQGGVCTVSCRLPDGRCPSRGFTCAEIDDSGIGYCLPLCRGRCPVGLSCLAEQRGRPVCMPCDCPQSNTPVCVQQRITYASACAARCAGHGDDAIAEGACNGGPMPGAGCQECPDVWGPVCADGAVRATLCDAECRGIAEIERVDACYPEPIERACRVDADCERTGCDGSICAAAPTNACSRRDPTARCFETFGACGCNDGVCGYRAADAQLARCLDRARGDGGEPPPPP